MPNMFKIIRTNEFLLRLHAADRHCMTHLGLLEILRLKTPEGEESIVCGSGLGNQRCVFLGIIVYHDISVWM